MNHTYFAGSIYIYIYVCVYIYIFALKFAKHCDTSKVEMWLALAKLSAYKDKISARCRVGSPLHRIKFGD